MPLFGAYACNDRLHCSGPSTPAWRLSRLMTEALAGVPHGNQRSGWLEPATTAGLAVLFLKQLPMRHKPRSINPVGPCRRPPLQPAATLSRFLRMAASRFGMGNKEQSAAAPKARWCTPQGRYSTLLKPRPKEGWAVFDTGPCFGGHPHKAVNGAPPGASRRCTGCFQAISKGSTSSSGSSRRAAMVRAVVRSCGEVSTLRSCMRMNAALSCVLSRRCASR